MLDRRPWAAHTGTTCSDRTHTTRATLASWTGSTIWANRDWGGLAKTGSLSSLQWARAKGYLKQNFRSVLLFAGAAGHVTILSWWWAGASADRDTALKLLYASSALERASQYGRAAVLVWWSSLFCSPTSTPRDPLPDAWDLSTITHAAVQGGHLLAAKWWWAYVLAARDQEDLQFGNDNSATSALEAGVAGEMLDWLWRISHSPRRHLVAFASQWPAPGVELPSYLVSGCVPSIDSLAWLQAKMLDPKIKMPFVWGEAETQCCCETGAVDVLEWVWQRKSTLRATWATTIAQTATQYGKALVLDWWWPIREQLPTQVRASTDVFVERAKAADLETLRWWSDRTRFDAKTWRMIGAGAAESGCPDLTHWWQSQASCLRPGEVRAGIKLALQSATTIRVLTMLHEMAFSHKVPLPALSEVLSSTQRSMTLVQLDYWCTVHGAKRAELLRAAPKALMAALEQSNFKILEWWIAQHASLGAKVTFNNLDQLSMHSLNYLKREWIDDVMVNRGIELFANDEWSMAVVKFTPQASAGPNTWY
ncbi:hypothetical protein BC828DRAFT_390565 [Blastocladiella britannica]|nr:hypothetical protein BC828DRAFT_390565 [Blastocladiella britannica]